MIKASLCVPTRQLNRKAAWIWGSREPLHPGQPLPAAVGPPTNPLAPVGTP